MLIQRRLCGTSSYLRTTTSTSTEQVKNFWFIGGRRHKQQQGILVDVLSIDVRTAGRPRASAKTGQLLQIKYRERGLGLYVGSYRAGVRC